MNHTATYSPEDNKLRLYPACRLDADTYARVKAAGFKWAPKQELFVAPAWTPAREDLLIDLCGEIGDEDTSLVERAETKAERLEILSDKRRTDAQQAKAAVDAIADNIPLGQPILVGHHSEKRARKDAERIENGMRKAIRMWDLAEYWQDRAKGAIHHAKYKELPAVRHRRIKGLESDLRKVEKETAQATSLIAAWKKEPLTRQWALSVANYDHISRCFPLAEYPRELPASQYEGDMSLWSALDGGVITPEQARDIAIPCHERGNVQRARWAAHYRNRLAYERAMLAEQGGTAANKFDLQVGGQILAHGYWLTILKLNQAGGQINSVSTNNTRWPRVVPVEDIKDYKTPTEDQAKAAKKAKSLPPICNYPGDGFVGITQAQWNAKHADYKGTRVVEATEKHGAHRVRSGFFNPQGGCRSVTVYITDAKIKQPPPPTVTEHAPELPPVQHDLPTLERQTERIVKARQANEEKNAFWENLREAAKIGVQVVSTPQLFPTPKPLAARLIQEADIQPGHRLLEPSAGTGALLDAIDMGNFRWADEPGQQGESVAVEINTKLAKMLVAKWPLVRVFARDFLECNGDLGAFDRIVMNPPFDHGTDIKHIQHAATMLKPGGRLVALCANGPRQREILKPLAEESGGWWEDLPEGSFSEAGTDVNVALLVIEG
jgi:phospholipid N-methyltransferase